MFGQMPQMPFQMPFMNPAAGADSGEDKAQQTAQFPFNMFAQFAQMPQMPFQMPQMPFRMPFMNPADFKDIDGQQAGVFSIMGVNIPRAVIQNLMNINWSPEELDKLQIVLDFVYSMLPKYNK